jgi:uncharacterized protein
MTNDLYTILSDAELDKLDQFLLYRVDEDAVTEGLDEGILDVSELDGFLTAIVSGPKMIPPSQWLPAVWGDFEPTWESEHDLKEILTLLMRHMNDIAATLMEHPEDFEPIYLEREVKGKTHTVVDEWCEGYRRGVALTQDLWIAGGREMTTLLTPILAFTGVTDWRGHDYSDDEVETIQKAIAPNVRDIHAFWLARRGEAQAAAQPVRRDRPRVGRNDPCPCGSGRKYKKCCLN